jgi:hypothetical protein
MARTSVKLRKVLGERAQRGRIGSAATVPPEDEDTNVSAKHLPLSEDLDADGTRPDKQTGGVESDDRHDEVSLPSSTLWPITALMIFQWCSGCSNGGVLVTCSFCGCRAACDVCIKFPPPATLQSSKFMCPVCHLELRENDPYFVSRLIIFDPL